MNAMSIMHDKWTDKNVGLNGGRISNTHYLEMSILPAQKTETITASVGISNTFAKTAMDIADGINQHNGYDNNAEGYTSLATNLAFDGLNNLLTLGTLGFGASATVSYTNTETTTSQNNTYNQGSAIISNKGSIDMTAENDINIKGSTIATNGENKEINLTSNNGDINITASKDTTNIGSNTHSNSVDIDLSLIPTYSYNDSETTIEQTKYNNSVITANENNSKINIESKNKDINIKGANIEADDDINLLAQNGNMNIESNQDRYYSNTDNWGMQLGGSVGFNVGKDYKEDITNNYTTIISHKKDEDGNNINGVNIDTNNLTLVGINQETRDNLNLDLVRGTITETKLEEKHGSEYYDFGITYSLPVSIGNLNEKVNNLLADGFNALGNALTKLNKFGSAKLGKAISNSKGVKNNISKPNSDNGNTLPPKTDSQSIINNGNWKDSWKNTTISYKDDNGWDFVASPNSAIMGGKILIETADVGYNIVRGLNPSRITYYGRRAFSDEEKKELKNTDKEYQQQKAHERAAEAYGSYVNNPISGAIIRTFGEIGQFFMYTAQDLYERIKSNGSNGGPYQPYCWGCEGGIKDSFFDIMNVVDGANGNYNKEFFPGGQDEVNKYNNEDYQKYINNGKKW